MEINNKITFKMRIIAVLLVVFSLISCRKKDYINHYINKPVTQQDLIDNGFYKYSYSTVFDHEGNKVTDTAKFLVKYDMYSSVKPEINEEGELCPSQLASLFKLDSIRKKEMKDYLKNDLNNRIITYLFRNDTLFYKSIIVDPLDRPQKNIADLTSKEKITKYYDSLKIPVKLIIEGNLSSERHPTLFRINNYKTSIQYSERDKSYEMFTNYLNESIYYDIMNTWYYGLMRNINYFLKWNQELFS